jgi:hypothetical protein
MQQKSDKNGGSVLLKTVGDLTAISKTVGEFLLCYCTIDEDLDGARYNVQRIRSRRRSCSELFDCLTELPRCDSILLDRCCSVINDQ